MLLAIDVGNTNIVLGVFDGEQLTQSWRLQTLRERTADEIGILVTQFFEQSGLDKARINGIILSSVVPPLTGTMQEMAERYFGLTPLTVDPATNTGMPSCTRRRPMSAPTASSMPSLRMRRSAARQPGAGHRRGLRHGDDVRRHFCGRRVRRRRHLPGHRDFGGRACFNAQPGYRESTCASRRQSSDRRR